jgi:coatomer subunit beta'
VKRIRNNHTIDEKLFYREVSSVLLTNHRNVVRFLGFCASTEQGAIKNEGSRLPQYFEIRERLLCFEYISNGNLKKHITGMSMLHGKQFSSFSFIFFSFTSIF